MSPLRPLALLALLVVTALSGCTLLGVVASPCETNENCANGYICEGGVCQEVFDGADEEDGGDGDGSAPARTACMSFIECRYACDTQPTCHEDCAAAHGETAATLGHAVNVCINDAGYENGLPELQERFQYLEDLTTLCKDQLLACTAGMPPLQCVDAAICTGDANDLAGYVACVGPVEDAQRVVLANLWQCIDESDCIEAGAGFEACTEEACRNDQGTGPADVCEDIT